MMCSGPFNIIYFVCHDLGKELGCYGKPIRTPNLNKFAAEGVKFTNAFCSSPACSPSRNCAYTGKHAHSTGAIGLAHMGWPLPENEKTVVDYFNTAGYETAHIGFQHERHGVSNRYRVEMNPTDDKKLNLAEKVVDTAIEYLKQRNGNQGNFYLNIGCREVHATCWQDQANGLRKEFYGTTSGDELYMLDYIPDTPELRKEMGNLQACIRYLDSQFGRFVEATEELGYGENTVIIFTTDHGISNGRAKGTLYDRGTEITLLMKLPKGLKNGFEVDDLIQNIDIAPTLLGIGGVNTPSDMQGRSFWLRLTGGLYIPHEEIFLERNYHGISDYDPMRAVRTRKYHYIRNFGEKAMKRYLPSEAQPYMKQTYHTWFTEMWPVGTLLREREELYDTENDPREFKNLAGEPEFEALRKEMEDKLYGWMKKTKDILQR